MNLTDLKTKPIPELLEIAHEMGMDNLGRSRKQEIIAEHTCVTYSVRYAPVPVPSDLHRF